MQLVCEDAQKQTINRELLQQAKIVAEAYQKFQDDFGGPWHPSISTIIKIAQSERLNDPANFPHLPSDINGLRHIALMKDTTFEQYRAATIEKSRPLRVREIKALREKLEPTEEQKKYNQQREKYQSDKPWWSDLGSAGEPKERKRNDSCECQCDQCVNFDCTNCSNSYLAHLPQHQRNRRVANDTEVYVPDMECCSRPFHLTIAVGDNAQYYAKFEFTTDTKSLVVSDKLVAHRAGSLYFDQVLHSDEALWVVPPEHVKELADNFKRVALQLEQIQREPQESEPATHRELPPPIPAEQVIAATRMKHLESPLVNFLASEDVQPPKSTGRKTCPGCGKPISANKKFCQACSEAANVATTGAQQTMHAHQVNDE